MADLIELKVPDIGDFDAVEVIEILISEGDSVAENQDIITLESDKAAMEIPASHSGKIVEMKISVGDSVSQGSVIALLSPENIKADEAVNTDTINKSEPEQQPETTKTETVVAIQRKTPDAPMPTTEPTTNSNITTHASPSVRKFARELGVSLEKVIGTGSKGRISQEDVQNFVKNIVNNPSATISSVNSDAGSAIPNTPQIDFSQFGTTDEKPLSRIKKISGKHLYACWLNIPHVTQFIKADITDLEQFRKDNKDAAAKQGVNLTPLALMMKATVSVLKLFPEFNASLDETKDNLIIKNYYNIGVAVDTPNGLMVPVIKGVEQKGILDLAQELAEISLKARDGKLSANDLQGGTFTISSLGGIGGEYFTPIVNAPEVAILGIGRHKTEAVWDNDKFIPRLMLPLSVSYDHRVIDGASGARFTVTLAQTLADIRKVLL